MSVAMNMFKTMMWKNWIVRKRHWFVTLLEAAIPCAVFGFLLYIRLDVVNETTQFNSSAVYPKPFSGDQCFNSAGMFGGGSPYVVVFTPNNTFTNEIITETKKRIWIDSSQILPEHKNFMKPHLRELKAVDNEDAMEEYFVTFMVNDTSTLFYGIVFNEANPSKFDYKIRIGNFQTGFFTDRILPPIVLPGRGATGASYITYCFLTLQKTLDSVYIEKVSNKALKHNIMMSEFPYPAISSKDLEFQWMMSMFLPFIIFFSFSIILPNVIKRVVEEKETGVKELMKMMGLRPWVVWVGWLLNANMVNIFVSTISTVILTGQFKSEVHPIVPYTNPVLLWLLLILFMNSITVFLFVVCAFLHRPLIASSVGMFLYFIPLFATQINPVQEIMPFWLKLAFCLLPTLCLKEGLQIIFAYNSRAIGVQFSNLFKSATDDKNDLSLGIVLAMMIFDIILYSIITMYVDSVRPGPYGRARPWHFVFTMFFRKNDDGMLITENDDDDSDHVHFENPPAHLNVGLSVRNLKKVFPPNVPAVNGVNIDIYKGQITALLGHNGAGKTTTMSILTGLFSPTSGTVHQHISDTKYINIFDNMNQFRQDLGLCPQHNMLFSYFTVMEHLLFFGMLKGMTIEKARKDGHQLLQTLNIIDKANVTSDKLSGGMKRKLSLAISLIASPKVLMLDEPTSGMDPESRREMWDILLNIREGRTIIITTHFMEEADVLGDRIAIMDHGKVRCYGTTMFLKRVYGAGYNMTLLTQPSADMKRITDIVTNSVAGSKLRTFSQGQLVYNLPSESSSTFANLFAEIERRKVELNVTSIGVSCTTMEEVFLKVGEISEIERTQEMDKSSNDSRENNFTKTSSTEHLSPKRVSGLQLIFQQFYLLLLKKVKFTYRKISSYIFFTLLAVLMVGVAVNSSQDSGDSLVPSLKVDMNLYKGLDIFVTYKDYPEMDNVFNIFKQLIPTSKVNKFPNGNITTELLKVGNENIERYRFKIMAASDWMAGNVTSLYSSIGTHSAPASLNLVTNTLLKLYKNDASIVVYNHPFSKESVNPCISNGVPMEKYMMGLKWLMTVPFGMLFVVANYIAFPLQERVSSAKHLQLMTGLSPIVYWLSAFIWDYLLLMLTSFLLIIPIFFLDGLQIFSHFHEIGVLLLIINLYGLSGIPFAYFFSFLKKSPAGASSSFIFYNIIFGIAGTVAIVVLDAFSILSGFLLNFFNGILMLNPFYCVALISYKFSMAAYDKAVCISCKKGQEVCEDNSYLSFESETNSNGIGLYLTVLSVDWILYFAIILLIDYGLMAKLGNLLKSIYVKQADAVDLDSDVKDELDRVDAARVNQGSTSTVLMVDGLKKTYGINFPAVRGISFAVNSGECFGLLGVNGAGKTTTFKMLTGDEVPTAGNATITKYSLLNNRSKYLAQIGYCPQFDAINELMTGREMLNLFGQLRGINPDDSNHLTNYWLKFLGLDEYSDRLCGTYSGGNKRKLSTAMALIGDPVIVFLDEPTSGVDPVARRKLWNVLARCQKAGQSIVLTSHSMDECEALCNRLTIMVKGQLVCLGNIQYLKQRFGQGFTIMVKLHSVDCTDQVLNQLKQDIETTFAPDCMLKDEHKGLLHYHVTDTSKTWSILFQSMDEIKRRHALVEDYTVSETTLEQVFISFAKRQ